MNTIRGEATVANNDDEELVDLVLVEALGNEVFRGYCDRCHWFGVTYLTPDLAERDVEEHKRTRPTDDPAHVRKGSGSTSKLKRAKSCPSRLRSSFPPSNDECVVAPSIPSVPPAPTIDEDLASTMTKSRPPPGR